jgi:hypothetical protein
MHDELDHLRTCPELLRLLGHYTQAGAADPEVWQDRLMQLDGVEPPDLVKLHGLLLAFEWLEQNTGRIPAVRLGAVPGCYRVTAAGIRAGKRAGGSVGEDEDASVAAASDSSSTAPGEGHDRPVPRRREGRKAKIRAVNGVHLEEAGPSEEAA